MKQIQTQATSKLSSVESTTSKIFGIIKMEIDGLKQLVSTVSTKGVGSYDKSVMSTIEYMKQDIKTLHS